MSRDLKQVRAEQATARYLWELLRRPGSSREAWERLARREHLEVPRRDVSQEAVRRLVTDTWYDVGQIDDPRGDRVGRVWKDRVSRVARGSHLSEETLDAFIAAFPFREEEVDQLRRLHAGDDARMVISGVLPARDELHLPPPQHETILLHEYHYIDERGLPYEHETVQVIRALVDGLAVYPFYVDTDRISVISRRGGRTAEVQRATEGLWVVPFHLSRPLRRGQTASLGYRSRLNYDQPPPPEVRRAAYGRVSSLEIYLQFSQVRLPKHVWWTEWEHWEPDSPIWTEERVELDEEQSVHRVLTYIERAVVGFRWEW